LDDHAVVREGYRCLLEERGDVRVVGEAQDAAEAYRLFCALSPAVVVLDVSLPGTSGIEAMRRMLARDAHIRMLAFSMHEESIFVRRALDAGAMGYVTKASAPDVLVEAVRVVAQGRRFLSADVAHLMALTNVCHDGAMPGTHLSPREFEVLRLLAQGYTLAHIARQLGLSEKTIANHQSVIRRKFGADNGVQLAQVAARLGLRGNRTAALTLP
jgi:DNA-binding NarL/FixJ family response regulator